MESRHVAPNTPPMPCELLDTTRSTILVRNIESLDQAIKVKQDFADSYTNLIGKTDTEKATFARIVENSQNHIEALESMRGFRKSWRRHAKMLQELKT